MTWHPDPYSAYCAVLRQAVERLLAALDSPLGCGWEREEVATILAQETGRLEAELLQNHDDIAGLAYLFADYLHMQLHGTPLCPSGVVPSEGDIQAALVALKYLTRQAWALEDQRSPGQGCGGASIPLQEDDDDAPLV